MGQLFHSSSVYVHNFVSFLKLRHTHVRLNINQQTEGNYSFYNGNPRNVFEAKTENNGLSVPVVVQTLNSFSRIVVLMNTSKNIANKAYRHSPSDLGDDHRQVDICTTLEKTQVVKKELKPRTATCLHTTTFILLCIFSLVGTTSLKTGRDHNPGTRNDHFRFPSVARKRHLLTKLSCKKDILRSLKCVIVALFF